MSFPETLLILKKLSRRVAVLEQKFENLLFTPPEMLPYGVAKARFEKSQQAQEEKTKTSVPPSLGSLEDDL
jgi:hypothetical protein